MIIPCTCGRSKEWEINRVSTIAMLSTRCLYCDPSGRYEQEPVEVLRKPRGRAGLWPSRSDVPFAPCDDKNAV